MYFSSCTDNLRVRLALDFVLDKPRGRIEDRFIQREVISRCRRVLNAGYLERARAVLNGEKRKPGKLYENFHRFD